MRRSGFKKKSYEEKIAILSKQKPRKPLSTKKPRKTPKNGKSKARKTTKASIQRRKKGIWATSTADQYFSVYIRDRDGHCLRCKTTENLTCSHFWGRGHSSTRFDPLNNIALCATCHAEWEGPTAEYKEFQRELIGLENYLALDIRSGTFKKRSEAVAEWKALYKQMKDDCTYPLPLRYFL